MKILCLGMKMQQEEESPLAGVKKKRKRSPLAFIKDQICFRELHLCVTITCLYTPLKGKCSQETMWIVSGVKILQILQMTLT